VDLNNLLSSPVVQWAILIFALIVIFIVLRYFFHIIMHVVRFIFRFFWHGCITVTLIIILLSILHYFNLI